jgi:predicted alpha/beta-fold hydrolase
LNESLLKLPPAQLSFGQTPCYRRGIRVMRLDLRGAGAGMALARKTYHAGCSGDVRVAIEAIHRFEPNAPIWLAGISLGGNVALKLAEGSHDNASGS